MTIPTLTVNQPTPTYTHIIDAAASSLRDEEFWVIDHPDGPLWETASKRLDHPVRVICQAMNCDWDDLTNSGFYLAQRFKPREE